MRALNAISRIMSDMLPPRRRLPPAQRRALILEAAREVFSEHGYAAGGIDLIGAKMGISGAAIYRHFARKQDILIALLGQAVNEALQEIGESEHSAADPETRLSEIVHRIVCYATRERVILRLIHSDLIHLNSDDRAHVKSIGARLIVPLIKAIDTVRPTLPYDIAEFHVRSCFALLGALATTSPEGFDPEMKDSTERILLAILMA
jgi:AcrR family transcriptional regulator